MSEAIDILNTNPTIGALVAFIVFIIAFVILASIYMLFKLIANFLAGYGRVADKAMDNGGGDAETTKPFLDVLLEQVRNNYKLLEQNQAMITLEAERLKIIQAEFKIAKDDRAAIDQTTKATQNGTLQIIDKVTIIDQTMKGGQTMLEQILERVKKLEDQLGRVQAMLEALPSTLAQKDPLKKEVFGLQSEAAKVEAEVKEVIETERAS